MRWWREREGGGILKEIAETMQMGGKWEEGEMQREKE